MLEAYASAASDAIEGGIRCTPGTSQTFAAILAVVVPYRRSGKPGGTHPMIRLFRRV
jgi:hypothetical protein